jgi:hypothetical protein
MMSWIVMVTGVARRVRISPDWIAGVVSAETPAAAASASETESSVIGATSTGPARPMR